MKIKFNVNKCDIIVWTLFFVLTFFVGFRWDVGIDWPAYMDLFGEDFLANALLLSRVESGNLLVKLLLMNFGYTDGAYFLWVMGFSTMFLFIYSINKISVNPVYSIVLFILLGFYFDLMNGVRQYFAISIVVYAWQFIFNRSFFRYFLLIVFAVLFHTSALLMLPVYWINKINLGKKKLMLLVFLSLPLSFVLGPFVQLLMSLIPQYEVYSNSEFTQMANPLSFLRVLFPIFIFMLIILKYDELMSDKCTQIITNLSIFSILITILFPGIQLMIRIGFYFQIALVFIIPIISNMLSSKNAFIFKVFSVVYAFLYIYVTQLSRPVANIFPFELNFNLADFELFKILGFLCVFYFFFVRIFQFNNNK